MSALIQTDKFSKRCSAVCTSVLNTSPGNQRLSSAHRGYPKGLSLWPASCTKGARKAASAMPNSLAAHVD